MKTENLRTLFHKDEKLAEETYLARFNSPYSRHINIKLNGGEAFYILTDEINNKLIEIRKQDKLCFSLSNKLPDIALKQFIKQCLIDEITSTNDIEGIYSSRQDINNVLENLEKQKSNSKFLGLVKSYHYLSKDIKISSSKDVREIYNSLLLDDIAGDKPDGKIFRKGSVSVTEKGKEIHTGILPEEKIIEYMDRSLKYLNKRDEDIVVRAAVFHYLLGYIHPFYDGNGRLNRFITSSLLISELEPLLAYSLSLAIKNKLDRYYKVFKTCNHILNKGDITPFIEYFVSLIADTYITINKSLKEKYAIYKSYKELIEDNSHSELHDLLLQATLFSEAGISTSDLLEIVGVSRATLRKRLNGINQDMLKINKIGNEKLYSFRESSLPLFTTKS